MFNQALFDTLVGPSLPPTTVRAMGPVFTKYEDQFLHWAEIRWITDGASWASADYYDRAAMFYAWFARTGDQKWVDRATALAVDYRDNYLVVNSYGSTPHWAQIKGVALHYAATGDEGSRLAVGRVADVMCLPYYFANLSNPGGNAETEGRIQARVLTTILYAHAIGAPSAAGHVWADKLRAALTAILSSQSLDGGYRFAAWQHKLSPYMTGMLHDAFIEYEHLFEADARILPAMKKGLDLLWSATWHDPSQSLLYTEPGHSESVPAPDLSGLIVNGFGYVLRETGDALYRARGDALLSGVIEPNTTGTGSKQFNQTYSRSYHYPSLVSDDPPPPPPPPPPPEETLEEMLRRVVRGELVNLRLKALLRA